MDGGSSIHRSFGSKSNAEFVSSLRSNLDEQSSYEHTNGESNGNGNGATTPSKSHYKTWTKLSSDAASVEVVAPSR